MVYLLGFFCSGWNIKYGLKWLRCLSEHEERFTLQNAMSVYVYVYVYVYVCVYMYVYIYTIVSNYLKKTKKLWLKM